MSVQMYTEIATACSHLHTLFMQISKLLDMLQQIAIDDLLSCLLSLLFELRVFHLLY